MYAAAIHNKVDIDILSHHYKSMQSIYSSMIEGMINNISVNEIENEKEYPTNYHWLIGEIFSIMSNWLRTFNEKENFVENSSYGDYFPSCIQNCLDELYKAERKQKIDKKFLISQFYYGVLTDYFSQLLNDHLRDSIEKNVIANIPNELVEPILKFSLDEKYAVRVDEFYNGKFHVLNNGERKILNRFRTFLIDKSKI